jgi:hypothetical protein
MLSKMRGTGSLLDYPLRQTPTIEAAPPWLGLGKTTQGCIGHNGITKRALLSKVNRSRRSIE